ncbi:hypothetical protein Tco_0742580 [Tanacetum coccineum]
MSVHRYTDDKFENFVQSENNNVTLMSKLDISYPLHLHPNDYVALLYNVDEVLGRQRDRVNDVVLGWILNSIFEELFFGQFFSERAKHVCEELEETYNKIECFMEKFNALIELPRCTFHAADGFKKHNQLMKLMQFLMGLDDTYMQIRSSILSRETLPDVRSAYATISSEDSYRVISRSNLGTSQRSQTFAFNANVPNRDPHKGEFSEDSNPL